MEVPDIQFIKSGEINIACQRWGTGPDVVVVPPLISNIEIMWENELWRRVLEFTGQYVRVLQFDKRGIGMSDRFEQHPTLEQGIGDITAVMDVEGIGRASLMGLSEGGPFKGSKSTEPLLGRSPANLPSSPNSSTTATR